MVWDATELSSPMVFRWYRSTWTDLLPVTLTLSDPFTVLELHWNAARTAYESRPVVLRCGRHSGTLRVNGVSRPLVSFRVTRFTFEVLLFLSDAAEVGADEPDLPRYIPHLGSYVPARLRTAAPEPLSPPSAAAGSLELQHRELVTRLAGATLLRQLSADVRQLRHLASANERHVEALAHELRYDRLQRCLVEAVRREVALLRAGRWIRKRGAGTAVQPGHRRRRPPPPATDGEEWEDLPDSPPRRKRQPDTVQHRVAFDDATTVVEAERAGHGLRESETEKDFVFEDLCRGVGAEDEAEMKTEKEVLDTLAEEPQEDEVESALGRPFGSDPDLYATQQTDLDLGDVTGSPSFVECRTVGGVEVTLRPAPRWRSTRELTTKQRLRLLRPWCPRYPADLTPGQRAAVLTGGQVIRGDISHVWTSAGQTLVNIESNGWEDVTVPFEKVLMVE